MNGFEFYFTRIAILRFGIGGVLKGIFISTAGDKTVSQGGGVPSLEIRQRQGGGHVAVGGGIVELAKKRLVKLDALSTRGSGCQIRKSGKDCLK